MLSAEIENAAADAVSLHARLLQPVLLFLNLKSQLRKCWECILGMLSKVQTKAQCNDLQIS